MIVVSTKLDPSHPWRKPGTKFAVQEVYAGGDQPTSFRVETPDGSPALVDAEHFDIVDGALPETWGVHQGTHGTYTIGPKEWQAPGFWERWMDKDSEAKASYARFRSGPLNIETHHTEMITPVIENYFSSDTPNVETLMPNNGSILFWLTLEVSDGSDASEEFEVAVASPSSALSKQITSGHGIILIDPETYSFSLLILELERLVQSCARVTWEEVTTALSRQFVSMSSNSE